MNYGTLQFAKMIRFLEPGSVTARMHAQARQVIPGATSRLHYHFKPYPIYARSGKGCRLTDIDGDERIDCLNNMTALIHGHADAEFNAAIVERVQRGVSFSEPAEPEVALARLMSERVPSVRQMHFRSSGTEAVMMAVKLARAFTGRNRIAKFEGAYHGAQDITVETNLLDARFLWGARSLFAAFSQRFQARFDAQHFFDGKLAEQQARHARFDDSAYKLEPNLKDSPAACATCIRFTGWRRTAALAAAGMASRAPAC